jgi:hypothetical protein
MNASSMNDLHDGPMYAFVDWPNTPVPAVGARVYKIRHRDERFIYVGMSGRGATTDTKRRNAPQGIYKHEPIGYVDAELVATAASTRVALKHGGEDDFTNLQALCFKCAMRTRARAITQISGGSENRRASGGMDAYFVTGRARS